MNRFLLSSVLVFVIWFCFGQNPDQKRTTHWYFGARAGLDFSSGSPVPDTLGQIGTLERTAAIADLNGNLVAYFGYGSGTTNQWCVWNRNHQPMLNGCGIGPAGVSTPRDGAVFIPKPGDDSTYYLFTVDGWENQFQRGLRWHEIDLRLDNGLGAVTSHDNLLYAPVTEQLAATRHANGCDYWVVTHERSSDKFLAFRVSSEGVDSVPVISAAGQDYAIMQQAYILNMGLSIVLSPNGKKAGVILSWNYPITKIPSQAELMDFNPQNGIFSNAFYIPFDTSGGGMFFSPDNSKLYVACGRTGPARFYQFDLSSGVDSIIQASRINVFASTKTIAQDGQIGLDGKLYLSNEVDSSGNILNPPFLSVIKNPNALGIACNVQHGAQPLGTGRATQGLPNFVSNFLTNVSSAPCLYNFVFNETNSEQFNASVYPNPADNQLTISSSNDFFNNSSITVYDATGRLWLEKQMFYANKKITLDISHIPRGLYLLSLQTSKYRKAFKIFIQH
ncbi:MAG: T9SS type A sorting domain-containing protein [Chitinophagales bacterium]|nr:T9SS type A sorting domain-containing protein [Chitinophagales bacterium]